MKKPLSLDAATARLEELCVRSEQCSHDLRQKLYKWGLSSRSDEVITGLIERKFVDDERFARAYVRDKYRFDRWGRLKIMRGLMAKRIPSQLIREALSEIDVKEYARNCYALLKSKNSQLRDEDGPWQRKQKLMRFAAGRGYEAALVVKLLDNDKLWD